MVPIVEPEVLMDGDHSAKDCYNKTSEQRKERFLSRQKQIEIAKSRGTEHFGPQIKK